MSARDLRFPRNADRWCGAVVLLVLGLSCATEKRMPETVTFVPASDSLLGATVLKAENRDVRVPIMSRIPIGGGYVLRPGYAVDYLVAITTTRGVVTIPWQPFGFEKGDSVQFPASRYAR